MKHSRAYKNYPTWRQREGRMLLFGLIVGTIAAALAGAVVYLGNRMGAL